MSTVKLLISFSIIQHIYLHASTLYPQSLHVGLELECTNPSHVSHVYARLVSSRDPLKGRQVCINVP